MAEFSSLRAVIMNRAKISMKHLILISVVTAFSAVISVYPYLVVEASSPIGWDTASYLALLKALQSEGILDKPGSAYTYVIIGVMISNVFQIPIYATEKVLPVFLSTIVSPLLYVLSFRVLKNSWIALASGLFAAIWFGKLRMFRDLHDSLLGLDIFLIALIILYGYYRKISLDSPGTTLSWKSIIKSRQALFVIFCIWLIGISHLPSYVFLSIVIFSLAITLNKLWKEFLSLWLVGSIVLFAYVLTFGYADAVTEDVVFRLLAAAIGQDDNFISPDRADTVLINTDNTVENVIAFADPISVIRNPIGHLDYLQFFLAIGGIGLLFVAWYRNFFGHKKMGIAILFSWSISICAMMMISVTTNLFDLYRPLILVPVPILVPYSVFWIYKSISKVMGHSNNGNQIQPGINKLLASFNLNNIGSPRVIALFIVVILTSSLLVYGTSRAITYQSNSPLWINDNMVEQLRVVEDYRKANNEHGVPIFIIGNYPDSPLKVVAGHTTVEHEYSTIQSITGPRTQIYLGKLSYFMAGCITPDANAGKYAYSEFYFKNLLGQKGPFEGYYIGYFNPLPSAAERQYLTEISSGIFKVNGPAAFCDLEDLGNRNDIHNGSFEFWEAGRIIDWEVKGTAERSGAIAAAGNASLVLYPNSTIYQLLDHFPQAISMEVFVEDGTEARLDVDVYDQTKLVAYHLTDSGFPLRGDGPLYKVAGTFLSNEDRWNFVRSTPYTDWKEAFGEEPPEKVFIYITNEGDDPIFLDDFKVQERTE